MSEDDVIEAIVGVVDPSGVAKSALQRLHERETENTKHFVETAAEQFLDERRKALEFRVARMSVETAGRLAELMTDEFVHLQHLYRLESALEARAERRRMLAWAAAGAFEAGLSIVSAARVLRALRALDPDDVLTLAELASVKDPTLVLDDVPEHHKKDVAEDHRRATARIRTNRHQLATQHPYSFDAILTSGCGRAEDSGTVGWGMALLITGAGHLVLTALADYIAVRRAEVRHVPTP